MSKRRERKLGGVIDGAAATSLKSPSNVEAERSPADVEGTAGGRAPYFASPTRRFLARQDGTIPGCGQQVVPSHLRSGGTHLGLAVQLGLVDDTRTQGDDESLRAVAGARGDSCIVPPHPEAGVGSDQPVAPDVLRFELDPRDRLLLCSDGLTDAVEEDRVAELLARPGDARARCDALVDDALRRDTRDNVTAVVAGFGER